MALRSTAARQVPGPRVPPADLAPPTPPGSSKWEGARWLLLAYCRDKVLEAMHQTRHQSFPQPPTHQRPEI